MSRERKPVPERFLVARGTLRIDRFMTFAIRVGGVAIIIAVFGIFFFILSKIFPLFQTAEKSPSGSQQFIAGTPLVLGMDEWAERPFLYPGGDTIHFLDLAGDAGVETEKAPVPEGTTVTATAYTQRLQRVDVGTANGQVGSFSVVYSDEHSNGVRQIVAELSAGDYFQIAPDGSPISSVSYADSETNKLYAALFSTPGGGTGLNAITFTQKRSLFGASKIAKDKDFELTPLLSGTPVRVHAARDARGIVAVLDNGSVDYLYRTDAGEFELRQTFTPFEDLASPAISASGFVLGDVSTIFVSSAGDIRVFSLFRPDGEPDRIWHATKSFGTLPGGAEQILTSQRNKGFLVSSGTDALLAYATTEAVRWRGELPAQPVAVTADSKFENLAVLDESGTLHLTHLHDPHPESGWQAFFGKVWYEGETGPVHKWQSTGGSDDFEMKLSMVPLIFGSLKGTLYAMLFAVPVALLAAVYTSQFLNWRIKRIVKPTMEIMASLPSVVLGFLGALWLAPLIETKVPSLMLVCLGLPTTAALIGWAWNKLPVEHRSRLKPGFEFLVFMPVLVLLAWGFWLLGPLLESALFTVTDSATGQRVADFRLWWPEVTGTPFEQRNSLVVGFMMGFAVIPIIFTIAEDSLSNVPPSLIAGSSALGASRWQVVRTVVLPIASAGIFSAMMIGFGRAVGETMIMVMATGNTPVMEWNIFSGMRTLAANIAVELPEAAVDSTHFRALFLGALILFSFTFVLNTCAELLRHRLREKFKLV